MKMTTKPGGVIQSKNMQRCERTLKFEPKGGTFSAWLSNGKTEFEYQTFDRTELQRWVEANGVVSSYRFDGVKADTNVPAEERRARWLGWYGKGERGAVQRVYERELLLNPKADRSFIGKEIIKAKKENNQTEPAKAMYGQLVKNGKRMG